MEGHALHFPVTNKFCFVAWQQDATPYPGTHLKGICHETNE